MRQAQHVAVAPAVALLVLHGLQRERLWAAVDVPPGDAVAQAAAPAPEVLHVVDEVEEVRAGPADALEMVERTPARLLVVRAGAHREREDRRIVARGPAGLADLDDALDGAHGVLGDALAHDLGGLDGQLALAHVIGP